MSTNTPPAGVGDDVDDRFGRARDARLLEDLAADDGADLVGARGLADEAGEAGAIVEVPEVVAGIGQQAFQHALLGEGAAGRGQQVAGRADLEVGAELVVDVHQDQSCCAGGELMPGWVWRS